MYCCEGTNRKKNLFLVEVEEFFEYLWISFILFLPLLPHVVTKNFSTFIFNNGMEIRKIGPNRRCHILLWRKTTNKIQLS